MSGTYRCEVCGYIHKGDAPPHKCPKCGVGPEEFEVLEPSDIDMEKEPWAVEDDDPEI